MLDLKTVLSEQENLEQLCQPVNLHRHEIYSPNDNYGHAYVMKSYAGYPLEKSILATFPHGIYFRDNALPLSELNCEFSSALCFPPYITSLWRKKAKKKKAIPFASPVHYALRQFSNETPLSERRGSLFLPKHSTAIVDVSFDFNAVLDELDALPDEFKPVTVCIHWQDIVNGLHTQFLERGFTVVTAGHFTDYNYMFRWLHLVTRHRLLIGCGLGSATFYSVMAGVPFYFLKEDVSVRELSQQQRFTAADDKQYTPAANKRMQEMTDLFSVVSDEISDEQRALVEQYTQAKLVMSPKALNVFLHKLASQAI